LYNLIRCQALNFIFLVFLFSSVDKKIIVCFPFCVSLRQLLESISLITLKVSFCRSFWNFFWALLLLLSDFNQSRRSILEWSTFGSCVLGLLTTSRINSLLIDYLLILVCNLTNKRTLLLKVSLLSQKLLVKRVTLINISLLLQLLNVLDRVFRFIAQSKFICFSFDFLETLSRLKHCHV